MSMVDLERATVDFALPDGAEARMPPERRGLARDEVRLLVARPGRVTHTKFRGLPVHLDPGDLVVVNTSATLAAALRVWREDQQDSLMHVAGELDDGSWVVELRAHDNRGPAADVRVGEWVELAGGTRLRVQASYPVAGVPGSRLWRAEPDRPVDRVAHLTDHGQPVRYGYLRGRWPLGMLQTVYADEPGSAEMPSAGRPFTDRVLTRLLVRGVAVAPVVLHTGLSSPEKHEPPAPERFSVPAPTAALVNATRAAGGRVVAVGTTVVRALESAVGDDGTVRASAGWTDLVVSRRHRPRVVGGLVTGLHEPEASHLLMLEAVAGPELVRTAYAEAVERRYLWHEFGDSMLFLPDERGRRPASVSRGRETGPADRPTRRRARQRR
jgi:S-adenosylmethionine:tRNA ribosyltransferase-isomerase